MNTCSNDLICRVMKMEQYLDDVQQALDGGALHTPDTREKLRALTEYMESGQWLRDYEADERGELPAGLKRGVLAQDTLYELLSAASHDGAP